MGAHDARRALKDTTMLTRGLAKKVTIHLNEDTSSGEGFTYERVFSFLLSQGVSGATLTRPERGFGAHHRTHSREGHGAQTRHLPVRIEFIEGPETVEAILPALCDLVKDGLIDAHDTTIVKLVTEEPVL
jgi:PII-like signaling protein